MRNTASRRAGFSLVELLVVVGIIAWLAAMLWPVLGRAREKARSTICAGNLRQIGQAMLSYEQDDGRFPTSSFGGYVVWDGTTYLLHGRLIGVQGAAIGRFFFCPSSAEFPVGAPQTGLQNLGQPGRLTAGSYYARSHAQGAPARWLGRRQALLADLFDPAGGLVNHRAGLNTVFSDGSVRFWQPPPHWSVAGAEAWHRLDDQ